MGTLLNPKYKPHLDLVATTADWDALKTTITTYLQDNASSATVDVDTMRALDDQFDDDKIWAQIISDMDLFEVAG